MWSVNVRVINESTSLDPIMLLPILFILTILKAQATTISLVLEKMVKKFSTPFLQSCNILLMCWNKYFAMDLKYNTIVSIQT